MTSEKTLLLHTIYCQKGIGETSIRKIDDFFPDANTILSATERDLFDAGLSNKTIRLFTENKFSFEETFRNKTLDLNGISILSLSDPRYPSLLKEIPDPPPLLYIRGSLEALKRKQVAIVGTRKPTSYGRHIARLFAKNLARIGISVVSGLALGLDAEAHLGAIESRGITVAVLGNGLMDSRIAPRNNAHLAKRIIENGGTLISQFPPDTPAAPENFPLRNRIIAGISLGTVVVEAGEKSGTLITARLALEYNREVFAVPGSILSPLSQGSNHLLKVGAHPTTSVEDILNILSLKGSETTASSPSSPNISPEDRRILDILSSGPLCGEEISTRTSMPPASINTRLTLLEIHGFITDIGGGKYILSQ